MLNAYPSAFGCHKSKTAIFKLINVKDHGIQKTRTTPAGNGKQLQILTFLDGRESVCRGSARSFFLVFGELTDNLINEAPKRSASEESAITCHGHL